MIGFDAGARGRSSTPRDLLLRIGRAVLWLTVVMVLMRGLAGVPEAPERSDTPRPVSAVETVWPDEAARAYAAEFAASYLEIDPHASDNARVAAAELAAPEIAASLTVNVDGETRAAGGRSGDGR